MIFRSVATALVGIVCTRGQTCGTCAGGTCGVPQPTCGTVIPAPAVQTCGAPPPTCGQQTCQPEPRPDIKIPDPIKGEVFEITRVEKKPMDVIIEKVTIKPETKMVPCHTIWKKYVHEPCKAPTRWDPEILACIVPGPDPSRNFEIVKKVDWEVHLVKHEVEFVVPQRVIKNVEWSSARPYYRREIIINMKPVIVNAKTKIRVISGPPAPDPPPPPRPAAQCSSTPVVQQQGVIEQQPVIGTPVLGAQPLIQTAGVPVVGAQPLIQQAAVQQVPVGASVISGAAGVGTAGVVQGGAVGGTVLQGGAVGGTVLQGGAVGGTVLQGGGTCGR